VDPGASLPANTSPVATSVRGGRKMRILDQLRNLDRPDEREILVAAAADHAFEAGDVIDFDGLGVTEVLLVHPPATSSDLRPGERAVRLDVRTYRDIGIW
jgi:hypothetical protein